jgi:hypothetical protein
MPPTPASAPSRRHPLRPERPPRTRPRPVLARERRASYRTAPVAGRERLTRHASTADAITADAITADAITADAITADVTTGDATTEATAWDVAPPALQRLREVPTPEGPSDLADQSSDDGDHPFGLPVLSEVPQLALLLRDLRQVDRLLSDVIDALILLEDTGLAEATTGIGVDTWLAIVGRRTGADTRMLRTTAATMRRSPSLHGAFRAGTVSWAQVRSVVLAVRPLPGYLDERIDAAIGDALVGAADAEPDALTRQIRWHLAAIDPSGTDEDERRASEEEYLAMQPRLDGTGGRFWGDLGAVNFAVLDAALNTELFADVPDDQDDSNGVHPIRVAGRARVRRLIDHLEQSMTSCLAGDAPAHRPQSTTSGPMRSRMQLLLRTNLSTLLDRGQTPAWLLTTLLGGHVRVTADTARRLVDERGADLRTVIIDDTGAVVGVGRRARIGPDWLKDATLALHDTCAMPGCEVAARRCETDHARPWHPARPQDPSGRTDIDQLAPGCSQHNRAKEPDGWVVNQRADGTRRWHHPRTGLTTKTLPIHDHVPSSHPGPD